MATYTLTFDGRNVALKKVLELFVTLGGKVVENDDKELSILEQSLADSKAGKTFKAKDGYDLIEQCLK